MRTVLVVRIVAFALALGVALGMFVSAVRTFVVPRGLPVALSRMVFVVLRRVFLRGGRSDYQALDHRMAFYAPTALLTLPMVWLNGVLGAFAVMFWAIDQESAWTALETSGSSLLTLGFQHPGSRVTTALSFVEAAMGL